MNPLKKLISVCVAAIMLSASPAFASVEEKNYTYGIEINGVLCGYADVHVSNAKEKEREYTLLSQKTFLMLSVLGFEVNRQIDLTYHIDPATGQFFHLDMRVLQDDDELNSRITVEGNMADCVPIMSGERKRVELSPGVILQNLLFQPHLKRDFVEGGAKKKTYDIFDIQGFTVQQVTYTRAGTENLELAGKRIKAVILEELNQVTGVKSKLWLGTMEGIVLKTVDPAGKTIYMADPSIRKKIEMVNYDENIVTRTNVSITDVKAISYMKVKAVIEPTGTWLTPQDLNIPGQRFEGTVKENLIEGVFEVEQVHYDGSNAPPYPPHFRDDDSLKVYLDPQQFIESDDPVLVEKAKAIAEESSDAWEAACRLSQWVADHIDYAIPGGGSARRTYDMRAGECGAHSILLAAFCRAVGIPARVVWGGVYTANFGGAFGQHAWNEIYMGEAGWIPVDSTGYQAGFVDSGHIRLGVMESLTSIALNAKSMEVLDHRLGSGGAEAAEQAVADKYAPYVGVYDAPGGGEPFEVFVQEGHLAVNMRNRTVLPLNDPDDKGIWACSLTSRMYCTFTRDDEGKVNEFKIHEVVRMRRKSDPETVSDEVPEDLRPYLGVYYLAAQRADYEVIWANGKLTIRNPGDARVFSPLKPSGEKGSWISEVSGNMISFDTDGKGKVVVLILDAASTFRRR